MRKPGSVVSDHLSSPAVTNRIKRINDSLSGNWLHKCNVDHLLAAGRVYLLPVSPRGAVSSYLTRFTCAPHHFKALHNLITDYFALEW